MMIASSMLLPRARPRPSPRNMQIYDEVRVKHERQEDVAARHSLTQQRVSMICAQVERWRQWLEDAPEYEALEASERRQRLLEARHREETVLLVALRQAVRERELLVTERRVMTDNQTQVTRTEKALPINPAWTRIVQSASRTLTRLNAKLGVDVQTSALASEIDRLWKVLLGDAVGQEGEAQVAELARVPSNP